MAHDELRRKLAFRITFDSLRFQSMTDLEGWLKLALPDHKIKNDEIIPKTVSNGLYGKISQEL